MTINCATLCLEDLFHIYFPPPLLSPREFFAIFNIPEDSAYDGTLTSDHIEAISLYTGTSVELWLNAQEVTLLNVFEDSFI